MSDTERAAKIEENALGPKSASGDAGSITQHSLAEQIAADKYLSSKTASSSVGGGLRFGRIVPPGAE
jgi:hypothetical protein